MYAELYSIGVNPLRPAYIEMHRVDRAPWHYTVAEDLKNRHAANRVLLPKTGARHHYVSIAFQLHVKQHIECKHDMAPTRKFTIYNKQTKLGYRRGRNWHMSRTEGSRVRGTQLKWLEWFRKGLYSLPPPKKKKWLTKRDLKEAAVFSIQSMTEDRQKPEEEEDKTIDDHAANEVTKKRFKKRREGDCWSRAQHAKQGILSRDSGFWLGL